MNDVGLSTAAGAAFADYTAGPSSRHRPLLDALVRHYDTLVDHVRRHIGSRGGDRHGAHDVVHDIWIHLAEAPPKRTAQLAQVHTPLAFLRHVATCRAIDLHRIDAARRRWQRSEVDLSADEAAAAQGDGHAGDDARAALDPQRIAAAREGLRTLAASIDALSPRCREVFVMHKVHDLPQAEVAERLGITLKAVEKHLRLGVAACRQALARAEGKP